MSTSTQIITSAGDLLADTDAVLCDIWGVLHNGVTEYRAAGHALERFRAAGGIVVLLSNSPAPSERVADILTGKDVRPTAWDRIVSSGDLTRARMRALGLRRVHHIGPDRDLPLFADQAVERVNAHEAEAIVVTGLIDDRNEKADDYRDLLEPVARRSLPLICANPDRVVDVGGVMLACAGAIAGVYEELGGLVYWEGKPFPHAYDAAIAAAEDAAGKPLDRSRVVAVGDGIGTDLKGAAQAGLDAIFVTQGIHRAEVMRGDTIVPDQLSQLLAAAGQKPLAAMIELAW